VEQIRCRGPPLLLVPLTFGEEAGARRVLERGGDRQDPISIVFPTPPKVLVEVAAVDEVGGVTTTVSDTSGPKRRRPRSKGIEYQCGGISSSPESCDSRISNSLTDQYTAGTPIGIARYPNI